MRAPHPSRDPGRWRRRSRVSWVKNGSTHTSEESGIDLATRLAEDEQGQFSRVVITPHRTLAVRHFLAGRDEVPTIGAMINRVEDEPLMLRGGAQIGFGEQRVGDLQAGLLVA